MRAVRCRVTAVVWLVVAALVSAQITFSRDWTGGKRTASSPHLELDCSQFTRLCRHFVHELKQAMSADSGRQRRDEIDKMYDDE